MPRSFTRSPVVLVVLSIFVLLAGACGPSSQGMPKSPGEYSAQGVSFDGKQYSFMWAGPDGQLHQAKSEDLKLVQGDRTYLEVGQGSPVLHLKAEEPISVSKRDSGGMFSSPWFPFMLGYAMGGGLSQTGPAPTTPSYRYPPTDTFGRGDTLHGSEATSRPAPPDYRKVQPAPNAVSGQNAGTGGGAAATNKDPAVSSGQSGGVGAGSAATNKDTGASGQSGGTGAGSAASDKAPGGAVAPGAGSAATDRGSSGGSAPGVSAPSGAPDSGSGVTSRPGNGGGASRPSAPASGGGGRRR